MVQVDVFIREKVRRFMLFIFKTNPIELQKDSMSLFVLESYVFFFYHIIWSRNNLYL